MEIMSTCWTAVATNRVINELLEEKGGLGWPRCCQRHHQSPPSPVFLSASRHCFHRSATKQNRHAIKEAGTDRETGHATQHFVNRKQSASRCNFTRPSFDGHMTTVIKLARKDGAILVVFHVNAYDQWRRSDYYDKVITAMAMRPLDDPTYFARSLVADLGTWRKL